MLIYYNFSQRVQWHQAFTTARKDILLKHDWIQIPAFIVLILQGRITTMLIFGFTKSWTWLTQLTDWQQVACVAATCRRAQQTFLRVGYLQYHMVALSYKNLGQSIRSSTRDKWHGGMKGHVMNWLIKLFPMRCYFLYTSFAVQVP